jgi:hypothetical protein
MLEEGWFAAEFVLSRVAAKHDTLLISQFEA